MFSSLPSASKIYQNSVKPRQKSASSAKKRRKKAHSCSNQHPSILDESVVSLVSCDQESSIGAYNSQDLFDNSNRHEYERENSSPELSLLSLETQSVNSTRYNTIPEKDNHAGILCQIEEKSSRKLSADLCSEQNDVIPEQFNETEKNNLFESNIEENCEVDDPPILDEKLKEESETALSPETVLADSIQQNLSSDKTNNENIKFDLIGEKDISEMTFEEVEASIEYETSKHEKAAQTNETADESIQPGDLGSNASLQSSIGQCSLNENNPDVSNVDSLVARKENNGSYTSRVENSTQSPNFDICLVENTNDTSSIKHEESADSSTVVDSAPHMDIILGDINGNCSSDDNINNSKEYWTNAVSCDSNYPNIKVTSMKENSVRTDSPEQSELSCTESVLCEAKDDHREILRPEKTFSDSTEKCESFVLSPAEGNEDCNSKSCSNISQSFSNLLIKDSEPVVSSRCSSVPEGLHLSKKFVDKHSQSTVLTVSDKATLTADVECMESSEERTSNEQSQTEECEHGFGDISMSGSEDKGSLWNVLPPLAMVKARSRSYVFGSKGPTGSLLGSDELSRFFPDYQVTVFVGTWNMNGHDPPQSMDDFLLPLNINTLPDIYAIGVQESMQSRLEWEVLLQTTLGPSHVLFTSTSLGVLHLCIFLRRDLIWFCSEPEDTSVATRPGTMVKTKGAVAVCFMCFGTSFLFVNSHLTAHEQKLKERLSDYEKIISSLELPKSIPVKNHSRDKDVTSRFDCVFWCGDLNFRVMHDRPSVLSYVEEKVRSARPSCSFLVKRDQLHKAMEEGRAFHGFKESVIHFIPSYKFDVGTSTFNSSKLRVPSYTDRILYRSKEKSSVSCLHYNAVPEISTSDHKPVYAVFKVALRPGRDNVPLAAGMFKRDVYLEAIKRRSKFLEVRHNQGQSAICSVM